MKETNAMSVLARYVLFTGALVCLGGCATSSTSVVKVQTARRYDVSLTVAPFVQPDEVVVADDWRKTGRTIETPDGTKMREGIYQYTFEGMDFSNLRGTLIESLSSNRQFSAVYDAGNRTEGYTLAIRFTSAGIVQNEGGIATCTCMLKAVLVVTNQQGRELLNKPVEIAETSGWTVGVAKNAAIRSFVKTTIEALDRLP